MFFLIFYLKNKMKKSSTLQASYTIAFSVLSLVNIVHNLKTRCRPSKGRRCVPYVVIYIYIGAC